MYKQGLLHDLSKYAPVEFLVGCKYYQGDRSPNNAEREDTGISKSWLHHKGHTIDDMLISRCIIYPVLKMMFVAPFMMKPGF